MPSAEIITIGTELLLGEITDTNARYLARNLRDLGIDLYRKTTVGDNTRRIAQAIQTAMERSDIIITTGGLGPTVDDPTREAVALAFNVPTEYHAALWEQIERRFQRFGREPTENNRRQAYLPQGAHAIENPVGTAPAFVLERGRQAVISLPGVPREMEYLLQHAVIPYLREHYDLHGLIKARVLHTAGAGESQIDDRIGDLEALSNPTVGLAAHSGQVDVRITAKAESETQANAMIAEVEKLLRQRLGSWVYGADEETLEAAALRVIQRRGWRLAVVEAGLNGALIRRLAAVKEAFEGGEALGGLPGEAELRAATEAFRTRRQAEVGLGVAVHPGAETQEVYLVLITPEGEQASRRPFGGAPEYAPLWALHHSLDLLRKISPPQGEEVES